MAATQPLFDNELIFGHTSTIANPKMKPFFAGKKENIHLFDLDQTAKALEKAKKFLTAIKVQNKKVLFVGTKPQAAFVIEKNLADGNLFYISKKWTPGLLTNFPEIRRRIDYFLQLKGQFETKEIHKYTKKEVSNFSKELEKLRVAYGGVAEMRKKPDVVVVLDAVTDRLAVEEANKTGVPVVALTDANADPDGIDYPIPGNDDSIAGLEFVLQELTGTLK